MIRHLIEAAAIDAELRKILGAALIAFGVDQDVAWALYFAEAAGLYALLTFGKG